MMMVVVVVVVMFIALVLDEAREPARKLFSTSLNEDVICSKMNCSVILSHHRVCVVVSAVAFKKSSRDFILTIVFVLQNNKSSYLYIII